MSKITKQFFSVSNSDAVNSSNINHMEFNFNNTSLTNIQTSHGQKCLFNPVNLSIDWDYINVSQSLRNNKIYVRRGANSPYTFYTIQVPDDSYNAISYCNALQSALNDPTTGVAGANGVRGSLAYIVQYDPIQNRIAVAYTAQAIPIRIFTAPIINENGVDVQYDATRLLGRSIFDSYFDQTVAVAVSNGLLVNPVYGVNSVDFKLADVIRIHSNVSKRFYELKNNVLSQNSVLFEIVVPNIGNGSVLTWENMNSDIYEQEIYSNFENLVIELRTKSGILIPFKDNANFSLTFYVIREIEEISPQDRINNLRNFNQLSSV